MTCKGWSISRLGTAVACLALLWSASAGIADTRDLMPGPAQCTPIYAVHKDGCTLEKFYRCTHKGQQTVRAETFSEFGLVYIDFTDQNGNTLLSWSLDQSDDVVGVVNARKLFTFGELSQTGIDDFDITRLVTHPWFADPIQDRLIARIELTGAILSVDGVSFAQARLIGRSEVNALTSTFSRYYYIDFEYGTFPWGSSDDERNGASEDTATPLRVIFPDDPDFELNEPLYGCGTLSRVFPHPLRRVKG